MGLKPGKASVKTETQYGVMSLENGQGGHGPRNLGRLQKLEMAGNCSSIKSPEEYSPVNIKHIRIGILKMSLLGIRI